MSDDVAAQLLAEMRYQAARMRGDRCANCGRSLAEDETVWLERRQVSGHSKAALRVPVALECVSPDILARTKGRDAEPCAGCGRGVYYVASRSTRRQALCSKRCLTRTVVAKRQSAKESGT